MKKKILLVLSLFLYSPVINATEYRPWFGNLFEFEARLNYLYQHFDKINEASQSFRYQERSHFADLSLALSPWPDWNVELEFFFAKTSETNFNYEKTKLTGRYLVWDDLVGDPFSFALGGSMIAFNKNFLDDFAIYEHGEANLELHFAIGKEIPECFVDTWAYRYYALIGIGQANRGYPWVFGRGEGNINFCDRFELGAYFDSLFGLGNQNINPHSPFDGYAKIDHQSLNIGAFYRMLLNYVGALTIDYNYRVYAKNFPAETHSIMATLLFTFSL